MPLDDDPESAASGSSRICDRTMGEGEDVKRPLLVLMACAAVVLPAGCGGRSSSKEGLTPATHDKAAGRLFRGSVSLGRREVAAIGELAPGEGDDGALREELESEAARALCRGAKDLGLQVCGAATVDIPAGE